MVLSFVCSSGNLGYVVQLLRCFTLQKAIIVIFYTFSIGLEHFSHNMESQDQTNFQIKFRQRDERKFIHRPIPGTRITKEQTFLSTGVLHLDSLLGELDHR